MTIEDLATPATATSASSIREVFDLQRDNKWSVRLSTAATRIARLERLKAEILVRHDDIVAALGADMGRPPELAAREIMIPVGKIDETIRHLESWMAPTVVENPGQLKSAIVRYEPRGVVLLFGPWNFPFSLLFEPLAAIIAAGNTAIVKPNEVAPSTSAVSAEIIRAVFDESEVAVFEGGVDVADELLDLPFDHIFLTGSPRVGRTVMAAAAKNLASVTLELGGKCPAIIGPDADFDSVIGQLGIGKMLNGGQVCLSVDYILVPDDRRDELVAKLSGFFQFAFYQDGKYQSERNSRVVNPANFRRLKGYLDDAVARGATVAFGGASDAASLVIEPTILTDVPAGSIVLSEEIFGPIVPVVGYETAENVISHIRSGTEPLAIYLFSPDEDFVNEIVSNTASGGVSVNSWSAHYWEDSLPFGGVGNSGMGRYHGVEGFRELSHARAVAFS